MDFRKIVITDVSSIVQIAKELPEWFTIKGIIQLETDLHFQLGYLATDQNQVIGFITFYVNQGAASIGWMGISPKHHRKGIGTMLINKLKAELKQFNIKYITVSTLGDTVDYEPYSRTRGFYRKNGFKDFQRIPHLDNSECEEELILRIEI